MTPVRYKVCWDLSDAAFCCGVREIGDLGLYEVKEFYTPMRTLVPKKNPDWETAFETPKEAWEKALNKAREKSGQRPIMINLRKYQKGTEELRIVLQQQDDCKLVHSWNNPGTDNQLEMYVLTNGSSPDTQVDEEYDEYDF